MKELRISVLGIGTELTQGQISNTNGQWISKKIEKYGVKTSCHLVVPDDRTLILEALKWCEMHSDFLFVTGGLGPTSDDFTRDLIAEHFKAPLQWHEPTWVHIQNYLRGRGIEARDIQKQQAFYPQGARVLENHRGTAHGFHLSSRGKEIFVLPGPPREIDGLWQNEIENWLQEKTKDVDAYQTFSWDCMGAGESEIASLTEQALGKHDFEIGYRVHLPYVEVKMTFKKSQLSQAQLASERLDQALKNFLIVKNGEDVAEKLCLAMKDFKLVEINASLAAVPLFQRLQKFWAPLVQQGSLRLTTYAQPHKGTEMAFTDFELLLTLESKGASAKVKLIRGKQIFEQEIEGRYPQSSMQERQLQYFAEKALLFWWKNL